MSEPKIAPMTITPEEIPAIYQRLVVQPNELARETPQIANHIQATRRAFVRPLSPAVRAIVHVRRSHMRPSLQTFHLRTAPAVRPSPATQSVPIR